MATTCRRQPCSRGAVPAPLYAVADGGGGTAAAAAMRLPLGLLRVEQPAAMIAGTGARLSAWPLNSRRAR